MGHQLSKTATKNDGVVVLDFETSGMSVEKGARAIEIGAVKLYDGKIVDRFESVMNPGVEVTPFIEELTGITNAEIATAPDNETVMTAFARFVKDDPLIAHNASFDSKFLDAEFSRIGLKRRQPFACTLKVARRVYPEAPNHKLATLVRFMNIQHDGVFHRALADAEMTARLWLRLVQVMADRYGQEDIPFEEMKRLGETPKRKVQAFLTQAFCRPKTGAF